MNLDVIIILTSENCPGCKMIKGDGFLDDQNTSRLSTSWWTEKVFKDAMTGGTDRQKFIVYEFFHKIHPNGYSYIAEFINYCLNPDTLKVEKHRYSEDPDGKITYQIDRNEPVSDPRLPLFKRMLLEVAPMNLADYYAFVPSVLFFDFGNYQKSLDRGGGHSVIAHVPGNKISSMVENEVKKYKIAPQMSYVNVRMDDYAKKVISGEVNLKELPKVDVVAPPQAPVKQTPKSKVKVVPWGTKRMI